MILALGVIATPAAAIPVGSVEVGGPVPNCEGQIGAYNISFTTAASLTEGLHSVCVKFPAGTVVQATGYPKPWADGDILIGDAAHPAGEPVFGKEVTVTGTQVCFLAPVDFTAGDLWVYFTVGACIINPPADIYQLEVWTSRAPDNVAVKNLIPYEIVPCWSTYRIRWNSGPTYPGIKKDFVPPFKACGQADNATIGTTGAVAHPYISGAWMNAFNLSWEYLDEGCNAPCENVTFLLQLTKSPQFPCGSGDVATVTLNLSGPSGTLTTTNLTWDPCTDPDGIPNKHFFAPLTGVANDPTLWWLGYIHFDTPGDYQICFTAVCLEGGTCEPPNCSDGVNVIASKCIDFTVHQWKDAYKLTLNEKWNLISLPLVPFDTDLTKMLSSVSFTDYETYLASSGLIVQSNLLSVWYYDAATKTWLVNGDGQTSLKTLEDGKAYWIRLRYPIRATPYTPNGYSGNYTWWVFGTERPEPPASPKVYPVVAGWNMVGFTSMTGNLAKNYLYNWGVGLVGPVVIYGWQDGCFADQKWNSVPFATGSLTPGDGYWMAFPQAGSVFQIVP